MTRTEITLNSYQRDIDKLKSQLERAYAKKEKKLAIAKKYGVDTMTIDQHNAWLETVDKVNNFIVNKQDIKVNRAWWDLFSVEDEIGDILSRLDKKQAMYDKYANILNKEIEQRNNEQIIDDRAELATDYILHRYSDEEIKAMQEQMIAEWLKDGIQITEFYGGGFGGYTPEGRKFSIGANSGMTSRSDHCFTLYIQGLGTIFTSGTISSVYRSVKSH